MTGKAFALAMIASALLIGVLAGTAVLNLQGTVLFAAAMATGAAVAAVVCSRWPGLEAAAWKLWPTAVLTNPVFLVAAGYSIDQYECLVGETTGWSCMFSELVPAVCALSLIPPSIGLVVRLWRRRLGSRNNL
jgi:hypothetical protein